MSNEAQSLHAAQSRYDNLAMEDFYGPDEADEPVGLKTLAQMIGEDIPNTVVQCSWCKAIQFPDGGWFKPGLKMVGWILHRKKITHGICPECDQMMRAGVKL